MRHLLTKLSFIILGLLLTACGATVAEPTPRPTKAPQVEITSTPLRAPLKVRIPTEYDLLYYPTDLNIVGITGRPQFVNAYADWCTECQRNRPLIHELQGKYGDLIDFLHVDVENIGAMDAVSPFGITGKTQYLLMNGEGEVLKRWYGELDEAELDEAISEIWNGAS